MTSKEVELRVGGKIFIPIPSCYRDCIELARSDYYRYSGRKVSFLRLCLASCYNSYFRFNFWLRLSAYHGKAYLFCKWMHRRYARKYGLQISPETVIGYGLYIGHGFGVVVNPTAIIGNNVNISQFTTIGSNEGQAAIVGNNVYMGPDVSLVEDICIGSDSCIGAGAVVTKDVVSGMTVAGVPAQVIGVNIHANYVHNRWEIANCNI